MGKIFAWIFRSLVAFSIITAFFYFLAGREHQYCVAYLDVINQEKYIQKNFSHPWCRGGMLLNPCRPEWDFAVAKLEGLRAKLKLTEEALGTFSASTPSASQCAVEETISTERAMDPQWPTLTMRAALKAVPYWLAIVFLPFLGRAVLFYFLAPIAGRSSFVKFRIGRSAKTTTEVPLQEFAGPGGTTLRVMLAHGDELLVHGNFVRSVPDSVACSSEWVYSSNLILRSLSSELIAMDSYKPKPGAPADITLGAGDCATNELAAVELAEGDAMIIAPRFIAGLVQRAGTRVRITSHWRLRRLSSWLLMRLRLLAVHGPCTVLITANRGVTAVRPGTGTTFDGKCLVGFRGPMEYTVRRTGSFWGNFAGKQSMFHMNMRSRGNGIVYMQNQPSSSALGAQQNLAQRIMDFFLSLIGL